MALALFALGCIVVGAVVVYWALFKPHPLDKPHAEEPASSRPALHPASSPFPHAEVGSVDQAFDRANQVFDRANQVFEDAHQLLNSVFDDAGLTRSFRVSRARSRLPRVDWQVTTITPGPASSGEAASSRTPPSKPDPTPPAETLYDHLRKDDSF